MSSPIASLFAELGFRVNDKGLKGFEKQLNDVANTIQGTSAATVKANKAADKSTEKSVDKHVELIKRIKSNYAKVQPSLEKANHELKEIQAALTDPSTKGNKKGELLAAQGRVEKRINYLLDQQKKVRDAEQKQLDQWFKDAAKKDAQEAEAQRKKFDRQKKHQDALERKEQRRIDRERREEARKEREAERRQRQQETKERQRRSEERQDKRLKLDLQNKSYALETKRNNETRRAQLHELRMQQRINNARRRGSKSGKGYYRGAREYGRAFIPGIGGAFAAMESTQAYQDFQGMQSSLTMATGSSEQADKEIGFLSNLANRLGMFVGEMGKNYASLSANTKNTSLEGEGTRQVFEAVSSYARVLNLSKEDQSGVFRALSQMVGKGQIYAEELRQQMGERAPGALQAMARAAGYGDSEEGIAKFYEAVEDGQIKATEVFPKFSEELMKMANSGDALEKAMNNTAASIGRFKTNVWMANKTFNEAGYDKAVRNFFNTSSDAIMRAEPLWEALGKAAEYVGLAIAAPIELFGVLAERLPIATEFVKENALAFKAAAAWMFAFVKPFRRLVMFTMVLPLGLTAISDLIQNWNRDRTWEEWVIQIGLAAAAINVLAGGLLRVLDIGKSIKSVFSKGGAATSTGASTTTTKPGAYSAWSPWNKPGGGYGAVGSGAAGNAMKGLRAFGGALGVAELGMFAYDTLQEFSKSLGESPEEWLRRRSGERGIEHGLPSSLENTYGVSKSGIGTQHTGDIHINVTSPDAALAGTKVEEALTNIFRTASGNEQVTEK